MTILLASVLALSSQSDGPLEGEQPSYSSDWRIDFVDTSQCGYFTSIALDSRGYPHISYLEDEPVGSLKYARWTGSTWVTELPDNLPGLYVGQHTSIAVDSNNYVHISHFEDTNNRLRYTTGTAGNWNSATIDYAQSGWFTSIAIDSADNPHISYSGADPYALKYTKWSGSAWDTEAVDWIGNVVYYTSIALDARDFPHISYFNKSDGALKHANWTGDTWNIETVDYGGVGWWTSIALDGGGNPHISYYDFSNLDLKYAKWNGNAWVTEIVQSAGDVGWFSSIAIDSNDHPHISYRLNVHGDLVGDLRYARWTGSSWDIEAVDYLLNVGGYTSIALDKNDDPHISYYAISGTDLKYATKADLQPTDPVLSYSPDLLDFGTLAPDTIESKTFDVWNSGGETLVYALNESIPWIEVTPPSGTSLGEHDHISVEIDTIGLPEGLHTGTISLTSNGGSGVVNVSVNVISAIRSVSLDIDPDTLNLKSKGRWITAFISAENASVQDIDVSAILLQDALAPGRWDYQDDVLMLKFDRQDFKDIVQVGESVQVKITGKWEDGTAFEAYDIIRVINPGK